MVYTLIVLALLGHFALCVAVINRLHAVAMPPWLLRVINVIWCLFCLGLPLGLACWYISATWSSRGLLLSWPAIWLFSVYLTISGVAVVVEGVRLAFRWRQAPTTQRLVTNHTRHVDLVKELGERPVGDLRTRIASYVPGNGILRLSIHEKTIALSRLPKQLEGLTIAHLSDLHFTGQLTRPFFHEVVRRTNEMNPDIVAITGDIIDKPRCLPWIPEILGDLVSRYGIYFILGNHDKRLRMDNALRQTLSDAGLIDLGGRWRMVEVHGRQIVLAGNELPWYVPAANMHDCPATHASGPVLRIALSHSPDQLPWARDHDIDLLLAGHTHGGQIQLPLLGAVLSPSWYGVKFAAGTFYHAPTLLHVTRGVSGTRPFRFNCSPELTKLVLMQR